MINFAQIRQQIPLKEFVEHVGIPLRREGVLYRGKCPFHGERRGASLIIYPDRHWFCQGKCHCGGDVIDFAQAFWGLKSAKDAGMLLLGHKEIQRNSSVFEHHLYDLQPAWPKRNFEFINEIVRNGISLVDLYELSPLRYSAQPYADQVVDVIFPGNPLLCIGKTDSIFATRRRKIWRNQLHRFPLIVPSSMLKIWGETKSGKLSQHTKEATAGRVYLVIEFDFSKFEHDGRRTVFADLIEAWEKDEISIADACSALLWHLAKLKSAQPFVMAVHSGGKSIHGWFNVFPLIGKQVWPFMRYAYQIGADHVTWRKSQFVRIPGGTRQDGRHQQLYFLEPLNAVKHEI